MSRLLAWSDLHIDYPDNLSLIAGLSDSDFRDDTLLVAGDVSSDAEKLLNCLHQLKSKFREIAFVPGNHDLWVAGESRMNSLEKLHELRTACRAEGIRIGPFETTVHGREVRIVPLLSWYLKPEEDEGSLFLEKPGEDPSLEMWADNYRIKWPGMPDQGTPAEHLLSLNHPPDSPDRKRGPVVTFSHFLPRVELVFHDWERFQATGHGSGNDAVPEFNFTRVAGCRQLDELLRELGSTTHVYGHQHRNRDRVIDGVRYVSHCLGYPPEWNKRDTHPPRNGPLEILPERP
jgi:predicted phosphodiesterase